MRLLSAFIFILFLTGLSAAAEKTKKTNAKKTAVKKTQAKKKMPESVTDTTADKPVKTKSGKQKTKKTQPKNKASAGTKKKASKTKTAKKQKPEKKVKTTSAKPEKNAIETGFQVARAAICTAVVNREPQGKAEQFNAAQNKIYCFSHIKGVKDTVEIQHKWYFNDKIVGSVTLPVRSSSWRTYSARTIKKEWDGSGKVEIINTRNNEVLKTIPFKIIPEKKPR